MTVTELGAGYRGSFATVLADSTGTGSGTLDWTFTIADLDIDDLGAGDVLTQDYEVRIDDGEGGIAIEIVALTLTGTNDAPIITSGPQGGNVTERADGAPDENAAPDHEVDGTISFDDVDLTDTHTVTVTEQGGGYRGSLATVLTDSTGTGSGAVAWTFTVADLDIDDLGAGDVLTQDYEVKVDDGEGGIATEIVSLTLTGTNDAPIITSGPQGGNVTERADGAPDENAAPDHVVSDTISFDDVDLIDTHAVTVTELGAGYRGSFATALADSTGTGSGTLDWTFSIADAAIDDLAAGETLLQDYEVRIDDGQGGIAIEIVQLSLTGTNDAPIIYVGAAGRQCDGARRRCAGRERCTRPRRQRHDQLRRRRPDRHAFGDGDGAGCGLPRQLCHRACRQHRHRFGHARPDLHDRRSRHRRPRGRRDADPGLRGQARRRRGRHCHRDRPAVAHRHQRCADHYVGPARRWRDGACRRRAGRERRTRSRRQRHDQLRRRRPDRHACGDGDGAGCGLPRQLCHRARRQHRHRLGHASTGPSRSPISTSTISARATS